MCNTKMRIDNKIMMRFPEIELSYGQIDHTKVCYDLYSIIPCGKKFFAWFNKLYRSLNGELIFFREEPIKA